MPRKKYMSVEYIESGTFQGGEEDAFHLGATSGAEFVVIRRSRYRRLKRLSGVDKDKIEETLERVRGTLRISASIQKQARLLDPEKYQKEDIDEIKEDEVIRKWAAGESTSDDLTRLASKMLVLRGMV